LPPDAQDKRSLVPLEPAQWDAWLHGDVAQAAALLVAPPAERFDLADAERTDRLLAGATPAAPSPAQRSLLDEASPDTGP
jgi:putative SOS response-associated peptidase YedK